VLDHGRSAPSRADWRSPVPLRGRIEAAAAAGFTGFGVLAVDLAVAEREHGLSGIRAMLADNGMVHLELEGLPDCGAGADLLSGPLPVGAAVVAPWWD
jgi:sugar phosphate isomerase/epimerase